MNNHKDYLTGLFLRADGTPNPARLSGKGGKEVQDALSFMKDKFHGAAIGKEVSAAEALYLIKNDIDSPPVCEICKQKSAQFYSYLKGYNNICGEKPCVVKKRERTNLSIYGHTNAAMADVFKHNNRNNRRIITQQTQQIIFDSINKIAYNDSNLTISK